MEWNVLYKLGISCAPLPAVLCIHAAIQSKQILACRGSMMMAIIIATLDSEQSTQP
jgi:hypothetical protein